MLKQIACKDDVSDHGGYISNTNSDNRCIVGGAVVAVEGAMHVCPIKGHGTTPITAVIQRCFYNGKLVLTEQAVAGCGARIIVTANRRVFIGS